jgi:hypothetical protein
MYENIEPLVIMGVKVNQLPLSLFQQCAAIRSLTLKLRYHGYEDPSPHCNTWKAVHLLMSSLEHLHIDLKMIPTGVGIEYKILVWPQLDSLKKLKSFKITGSIQLRLDGKDIECPTSDQARKTLQDYGLIPSSPESFEWNLRRSKILVGKSIRRKRIVSRM